MSTIENKESAQLEWTSPVRVYRPWDRERFARLGTVVLFAGLFLIFFKQFWLLVVALAFLFVAYALGTVPPGLVTHRITAKGISSAGHFYSWEELLSFHFVEKGGVALLCVNTKQTWPGRLVILLSEEIGREKITGVLSPKLEYREAPPTNLSKRFVDAVSEKLGLS